jgi:SSS family solute:Na+ symporter
MSSNIIMLCIACSYVVITTSIGVYLKKFSKNSESYMTGGKSFGPFVIGALMMSEFIAVGSTIGTAQTAFSKGISASWNIITLIIAFLLFAFLLAKKFHQRGEYTISGAISKSYGNNARTITSLIMTYALIVSTVSTYAGGAATLSVLLHIPKSLAVLIVGIMSVIYVTAGGMFAVAYTNLIHVALKYIGVILAVSVGLAAIGGYSGLSLNLKPEMLSWTSIGLPTIIAWTIGNIGAIFSTQYIIQAVTSTPDSAKAKRASIYAGIIIIPIGLMIALIGMSAKVIFPNISSEQAFPILTTLMNPFLGGLVVAGLVAAVFSASAAAALGCAALLMKDFYIPFLNKNATEAETFRFSRIATIIMGLIPIPFAIFVPEILNTMFFARALRTSIAIVVILMFYYPKFSSGRGASLGLISAVLLTTGWYMAGNPFGIDSIYVAAATPLIVMGFEHLFFNTKDVSAFETEVRKNSL